MSGPLPEHIHDPANDQGPPPPLPDSCYPPGEKPLRPLPTPPPPDYEPGLSNAEYRADLAAFWRWLRGKRRAS